MGHGVVCGVRCVGYGGEVAPERRQKNNVGGGKKASPEGMKESPPHDKVMGIHTPI